MCIKCKKELLHIEDIKRVLKFGVPPETVPTIEEKLKGEMKKMMLRLE